MSDDKIADMNQKQSKNPIEASINKIKESAAKEAQQKFDDQVRKTIAAGKIFNSEKEALAALKTDSEEEKLILADILKAI